MKTFYFPGWRAAVGGQRVPIVPTDPYGLISLAVPAGLQEIEVRFGPTPIRVTAAALSMSSLLGLVGVLARSGRNRAGVAGASPVPIYLQPLKMIGKEEEP